MGLMGVGREYVGKLIKGIMSTIVEVPGYTSSKPFEELSSAERYGVRYLLASLALGKLLGYVPGLPLD